MSREKKVGTPEQKPRAGRRLASLSEVRQRLLADPDVKLHYDELRIRTEIGVTIARARKELGLTQAQLAELAGTKQSVIARLETGRGGIPSLQLLDRVVRALGFELTVRLERPKVA